MAGRNNRLPYKNGSLWAAIFLSINGIPKLPQNTYHSESAGIETK